MAFNSNVVTAVQAQIASGFSIGKMMAFLEAIDVVGGVVNMNGGGAGVVTIGGRGLTNYQYMQLYEMLGGQPQIIGGQE